MSKSFLLELNGACEGSFKRWLASINGEPRVAWYPSAGTDFRDVLYLSKEYRSLDPIDGDEPATPDLFLHTDYFPWSESSFLDSREVYSDEFTKITLESIEELPRCDLPLDPALVDFPRGSDATGRVVFLMLSVESKDLGSFKAPVLYVFSENTAFCAERLLSKNAKVSHLIHVRYGGGLGGGGKARGAWLLNVLQQLGCEYFLTDGTLEQSDGDRYALEKYPSLNTAGAQANFSQIRQLDGRSWSNYGDISWRRVGRGPKG